METRSISFKSRGQQLVGTLFLPDNFDEARHYPTVIFSGPLSQIKELTGTVYGRKLAAEGFILLAFDHEGFGESGGTVRNYEDPFAKMENIRDAISHLGTLPYADRDRLYGLGVCAGGGLFGTLGVTEKRLAAVATASGYMSNIDTFFKQMTREQSVAMMKGANAARQKAYETGEVDTGDFMGLESLDPARLDKNSVYYNAYDFYMTDRSIAKEHPRYSHIQPVMQGDIYALCNAIPYAPYFYTPYLGVIGTKADTGYLTEQFFADCSEPKELFKVEGANHISLYDQDEYVDQVVARLVEFFNKHQGSGERAAA